MRRRAEFASPTIGLLGLRAVAVAFVDDIEVSSGDGTTSFEDGLAGWTVPGAPPGSAPNPNDVTRTTAAGFPEGAAIATENTIYFGFGFEGITDAETRNAVIGSAMEYLLRRR